MLVFETGGEAQTTAFNDGGVILLVVNHVVFAAGEAGDNAEVNLEAGGVDHHILLADVFGDSAFELLVEVECAVEEG